MLNKSFSCLFAVAILLTPLAVAIPLFKSGKQCPSLWDASLIFFVSIGCILRNTKVHCVGGQSGAATNPIFQTDHYTLDLSRNYVDLNTLSQGWSVAAPLPEANSEFVLAASGTSNFFINGGTGLSNGKPLLHQSIIYNAATNSWDTTIAAANATDTLVQA
jgi:hypothetical protein